MTWHTLSDQQPNDGERVILLWQPPTRSRQPKPLTWTEAEYCTHSLSGGSRWIVRGVVGLTRAMPDHQWARVTTPDAAEPDGLRLVTMKGNGE